MRRSLRYLAVVVAAAVLMAGTAVSLTAVAGAAVHNTASAREIPLAALTSQIQVGSTVYADDGHTVLDVFTGPEFRQPVKLSQVSKTMVTAVLDTEDHGFYRHGGYDIPSIVRALVNDSSGSGLQGGSTIPQQLVKQLYLSSTRKISRKIKEAVLADRLEQHYSKNQILEAYLNTIYLGDGAYGAEAAAQSYFQEPASRLDLAQSALLAGMIQNPTGLDPFLHPDDARQRRTQVLNRMVVYHDITPAQAAAAGATPLPTKITPPATTSNQITNYYLEQVRDQLLAPGSPLGSTYAERYSALFEGGLKIYTNLDPTMQAAAEKAVADNTPTNSGGFLETLVSIDPSSGKVRDLVGGAPGGKFDIVTQGARQPGSGFKLFTLLAALEQGYSVYDTVDGDAPCAIRFPGNIDLVTKPIKNDTATEGGIQPLVKATANSVNCAYIRLAHEVGLANVVSMANRLGISPQYVNHKTDDFIPSMVIGAEAVPPIEMAAAYAAVASGGVYHRPSFIDHVDDRTGDRIYSESSPGQRVLSTQVAAEADVALQAVVQYGTGTAAALYNRPVAGKTGTTENNVDAWFNGYTPQLETSVWIGNEADEKPIIIGGYRVYGADYPARTWHEFNARVLASDSVEYFPTVSYYQLPATKFITSRSLVADDVLDHNSGRYNSANGTSVPYGYGSYGSYGTTPSPSRRKHSPGTGSATTIPGGSGGSGNATTATTAGGGGPPPTSSTGSHGSVPAPGTGGGGTAGSPAGGAG